MFIVKNWFHFPIGKMGRCHYGHSKQLLTHLCNAIYWILQRIFNSITCDIHFIQCESDLILMKKYILQLYSTQPQTHEQHTIYYKRLIKKKKKIPIEFLVSGQLLGHGCSTKLFRIIDYLVLDTFCFNVLLFLLLSGVTCYSCDFGCM